MEQVFLLQHECELSDEAKLLGVFETEDSARSAMLHYTSLPGFRDYPEGFSIDTYKIGEMHWVKGFIVQEDN